MHLEMLELVHQESKRLPPIPKVSVIILLSRYSYMLVVHCDELNGC